MKSRKIIVDCKLQAVSSGGISTYFKPLLRELILTRPNDTFYLAAPQEFDLSFLQPAKNVRLRICKIPDISNQKLAKILYHCLIYPRFLKQLAGDFLISPYYDFMIPRFYKKKSVFYVYDACYWQLPECYSWFSRNFHKLMFWFNKNLGGSIFTISDTSRDELKALYPNIRNPIERVYCSFENHWVDGTISDKQLDGVLQSHQLLDSRYFFYTGGVDSRKNIEGLLHGFSLFIKDKDLDNFKLVITGNSKNPYLESLIEKYDLQNHVALTGFVDRTELGCLYKGSCGAVTVSFYEGFGLTTIEAKSMGIPLLCSDIPVFREVVGDYPVYCDPGNVQSIANGMIQLSQRKHRPEVFHDERFDFNHTKIMFTELIQKYMTKALGA